MTLFVPLDANWVDHPKIIAVGLDGAGLHAAALCMAKRLESDGVLHRAHLRRVGADDELIDRLIDARLLDRLDGHRVRVHGWHDRNPSQGAIDATRTARREAARAGNHRRWGHPGPVDKCPTCNPPDPPKRPDNPTSSHGATGVGSHPDPGANRVGSPETETETETETENSRSRECSPHEELDPADPGSAAADQLSQPRRQRILRAACELIADRAAARPGADNPAAMRAAVLRQALAQHHDHGHELLTGDPTLTPDQLADLLEPPTQPTARPAIDQHQADHLAAQKARAERAARRADGTACPHCGDTGLRLDNDGFARPCHHQLEESA